MITPSLPCDLPPSLPWTAAACLLDASASADRQLAAAQAWHAACLARVPPPSTRDTALPSGKALSPLDAARCVLDVARTARLLQAVDAALALRLGRDSAPVDLLYAGCGPLAPLVLACAQRHAGRRWRAHLIDVHATALASASQLFDDAGLRAHLGETICADAARVRLPAALRPAILVAEVMQRALSREPQVAVVANLVPQCRPDVQLIPERIEVSAWLARVDAEQAPGRARERIALGTLLSLSRDAVPAMAAAIARGDEALPERVLSIPAGTPSGRVPMLATRIAIDRQRALGDYDSGLTWPQFEFGLAPIEAGQRLGVRYLLQGDPGFRMRRID